MNTLIYKLCLPNTGKHSKSSKIGLEKYNMYADKQYNYRKGRNNIENDIEIYKVYCRLIYKIQSIQRYIVVVYLPSNIIQGKLVSDDKDRKYDAQREK